MTRPVLAVSTLLFAVVAGSAIAQTKPLVKTAADLPRFSYAIAQPPSALLGADDATFLAFAGKVGTDVDSILANYTIEDKATLRQLLSTRESVQLLNAKLDDALATADRIRDLQDKPEAKLTSGLSVRAMAAAYKDTHATGGAAFEQAYGAHFASQLQTLPWATVQESMKNMKTADEMLSPGLLTGVVKANLDPEVAKSGGLDLEGAERLLSLRVAKTIIFPLAKMELAAVTPYIAAHNVAKSDIWAAREVTLTPDSKLTPVRIAIFDSGVDTALYPGRLFVDPKPGKHSAHGLAFDMQGNLYNGDLQPLTPEQKSAYPMVLSVSQGLDDLRNGIASPAAADARTLYANTPPDQLATMLKKMTFLGQYMHGTHVAGIAVRGNPAARLVVVQFNDGLPDLPFVPTVAWAEKFKADFLEVGQYLRAHDVRVVNMSWADSQGEIEEWLTKTSSEKDPAVRKQLAAQIYAVWRDAVEGAIKAAPDTLWVCAAGNSNSDPSFLGDVPASLHLPNLITVGAVDQSGDETSFTSYGDTVVLDADGYQVESYVPGGTKLKESGTSMASPNVVNLAAKLIALDPKLTPAETIALMEGAADKNADGRLHLINPKATVALLGQRTQASR